MNQLVEKIAAALPPGEVLPFARFMELALYCPVYGYYEKEKDTIGRAGDFFTSVSVGPLFGQLLACQFAHWLEPSAPAREFGQQYVQTGLGASPSPPREERAGERRPPFPSPPNSLAVEPGALALVEAGAHRGQLAHDILSWLRQRRPALFARLHYYLIEPSPQRRLWQGHSLAEFASQTRWLDGPAQLPSCAPAARSIIFSNELLDALPVHRLGWDSAAQSWFEWGVAWEQQRFVWRRLPLQSGLPQALWPQVPPALGAVLPQGYIVEVCPQASAWWAEAAGGLGRGKLLTLDYGLSQEELFMPERSQGTLRAYRGQRLSPDLLAQPGQQDLTAHVNFSAIQQAGEACGLRTQAFQSQAAFLTGIAARIWSGELDFGEWTGAQTSQFKTLTHPEHLGRPFRVLIQERD